MHPIRWLVRGLILFLCIFTWGSIAGMSAPYYAGAPPPNRAIQTTTPQPDGSYIHEVRQGENLWAIAVAYGVYIYDIQRLNKLPLGQDKIIIGQKLTIPTRSATPVTPSATPSPSPLPASQAAVGVTVTLVGNVPFQTPPAPFVSLTPTLAASQPIPVTGRDLTQTIQTALVILAVIGVALIVFGIAIKR